MNTDQAPRVANAHENGRAASVVALAAGSLPVLDAEGLAKLWEGEAYAIRSNATRPGYHTHATISRVYAKADQLEQCAKELRLLVAHTNQRQPEENAAGEPHAPNH